MEKIVNHVRLFHHHHVAGALNDLQYGPNDDLEGTESERNIRQWKRQWIYVHKKCTVV